MNMTRALDGFLFTLKADGYLPATVDLYRIMPITLAGFLQDRDVTEIVPNDITKYFAYLRSDYVPRRQGGDVTPYSGSTLQNHWKAIRRFFRWAEEDLGLKSRPDTRLKLPPNNPRAIMPMLEEEVRTLVEGAEHTRQAAKNGRCVFRMKRPTAERDTALIVLMLDTGIGSGEASRLNIKDIDLGAGEIIIYLMAVHRGKQRVVSFRLERQHVA